MTFLKILVFSLSLLICNFSYGSAAVDSAVECENTFQIIQEFRYVLSVAGNDLSTEQQELAAKFLELLDQEMGPQISCLHIPSSAEVNESNILTLKGATQTIVGIMNFDDVGEIDGLIFEEN